jgi:hypothetical protein
MLSNSEYSSEPGASPAESRQNGSMEAVFAPISPMANTASACRVSSLLPGQMRVPAHFSTMVKQSLVSGHEVREASDFTKLICGSVDCRL